MINKTVKERFEEKIYYCISGCWLWTGGGTKNNYGRFWFDGGNVLAHRMSYVLYKNDNIDGIDICHHCDNTLCVNPNHLFAGDQTANMQDMLKKHRDNYRFGETHADAKLSAQNIISIRENKGSMLQRELGELYGVTQSHISKVLSHNVRKKG